ncbi:MAG: sugar transferase [Eubacterium sp.]|nr:sugar transferase [Eubacterium sp.]
MYKKNSDSLIKHIDFIVIDVLTYCLSFWLAYVIRHRSFNMFSNSLYLSYLFIIVLLDIVIAISSRAYKGILYRGYLVEFRKVLFHSGLIFIGVVLLSFLQKVTGDLSRIVLVTFFLLSTALDYVFRVFRKRMILKKLSNQSEREVLLVSDLKGAKRFISQLGEKKIVDFNIIGIVLCDKKQSHDTIFDVPIVAYNKEGLLKYLKKNVVDELIFANSNKEDIDHSIIEECEMSGMTVHIVIDELKDLMGETAIETMAGIPVVSSTIKMVEASDILLKRIMDIIGSIFGLLITGIVYIFVAPMIYISDPGPVIFSQTRLGKNGRTFKIYKFRTMYKNAEEKKEELLDQNEIRGYMFKLVNDPRILGSGEDGTKKGIGYYLRAYSIDELPQFWNILKGDMSLVGTRPPTMDEWKQYENYQRIRMRIKPGLTGLWQVSGRSNITDFEEVVRLDSEYIRNWSIWEDIKIILQTFRVVIKREGSK